MIFEEAHRPVLLDETVGALRLKPGGRYVDLTAGRGGHAEAIVRSIQSAERERGATIGSAPEGCLTVMDRDPEALALVRQRLAPWGGRVRFVAGNFDRFDERAGLDPSSVDGIIADLGVSSPQLDQPGRGFSFQHEGPLDMRMDTAEGPTALECLRRADPEEIEGWLRRAGEDRFARRLARRLVEAASRIRTTTDLAGEVVRWVPRRGPTHPATRVFLALRMAVNRELESLESMLARAPGVLACGGRLAVISFHSGEDRIVKWFGRRESAAGRLAIVTKKPIVPSENERKDNPRSRSAKLRVFEKI